MLYYIITEVAEVLEPKIQRALDLLMNMGYNNEGGWLSSIIKMKNGDINQVLDMLHPIK